MAVATSWPWSKPVPSALGVQLKKLTSRARTSPIATKAPMATNRAKSSRTSPSGLIARSTRA